ncbi:MAG: hypothetical protein ABFC88_13120 [Thermoguttaceae bacterium]
MSITSQHIPPPDFTDPELSPEEFAAQWGADPCYMHAPNLPGDGYMFYNFAVEKNDPTFLAEFIPAIERTIAYVEQEQAKQPNSFEPDSVADLTCLLTYVKTLSTSAMPKATAMDLTKTLTTTDLDEFTRNYLICCLWAENDESDESGGEPLDSNYHLWDFAPEALTQAAEDCLRFQEENAADLAQYNHPQFNAREMGGHDFFLTRNHHGCGFWDRHDCLPEDAGERLTDAAEKFGECDPYVGDDGLIYFL